MFLYQKWCLHFLLLFYVFWIIHILWSLPLMFCWNFLFPAIFHMFWIAFCGAFQLCFTLYLDTTWSRFYRQWFTPLWFCRQCRTEQFINWRYGLLSLNLSFLIKVGNNGDYYLQKHNYFCEHWLQFIWTIVLHGPKLLVLSGAKVMNRKALAIIFDNFLRILVVRTTLSVTRFKSVNHKIDCDGQA